MKQSLFLAAAAFLLACNAPAKQDSATGGDASGDEATKPGQPAAESFEGCYQRVLQRDTVHLRLLQKGDAVSGTLRFDNYEKDASSGTVEGRVENGRLMLWYAFMSEGMHSVSQVVLKREGTGVIMGTGPIEMRGDTALFQKSDALSFDRKETLARTACN